MKKISYQIMTEVNHGTEADPNVEQVFTSCEIWASEVNYAANFAIAQAEAYGEVSVEDAPDEPSAPTPEERIAALEDATCEMDAAYAAQIAALEDAICDMDAATAVESEG